MVEQKLTPHLVRGANHLGGIAVAVRGIAARDAPVVAQQRLVHVTSAGEIVPEDVRPVTDVGLYLQQILRLTVELAGVEVHHLHEAYGPLAAHRLGFELGANIYKILIDLLSARGCLLSANHMPRIGD